MSWQRLICSEGIESNPASRPRGLNVSTLLMVYGVFFGKKSKFTHSLSIRNSLIRNDPSNCFNHKKQGPIEFSLIRNDFSKKWIALLLKCCFFSNRYKKADDLIKNNSNFRIALFQLRKMLPFFCNKEVTGLFWKNIWKS